MVDKDGKEIVSNAFVYVLQDLDDNGMLFHGTLADLNSGEEGDPTTITKAYEIKRFYKIPSLSRAGDFYRKAFMGWRQQ